MALGVETYTHTHIQTRILTSHTKAISRNPACTSLWPVCARNLWAAEGGKGAWNSVPWQSKLCHDIWKFIDVICGICVIETESSWEIECNDAQQEVEVRIVTPFRKKRRWQLTWNPQLYLTTGNSLSLLFCHHAHSKITRFHFPYMEST